MEKETKPIIHYVRKECKNKGITTPPCEHFKGSPQLQEKTSEKQDLTPIRNEKGQIIKGTANPYGRPKGSEGWATIYRKALMSLAKKNNIDPDDLDAELVERGIAEARKGNFNFWQNILDRNHGRPTNNIDVMSGGEKISVVPNILNDEDRTVVKEFHDKLRANLLKRSLERAKVEGEIVEKNENS